MLRKLAYREVEVDAVSASIRISEALGGVPLAIFQMSAIIRELQLTFKDFEDWYRKKNHQSCTTGRDCGTPGISTRSRRLGPWRNVMFWCT